MKRTETREKILSAALGLFARYGYNKTTLEDVAAETEMSPGNIYFYVKDKKGLYREAIRYGLTGWMDHVGAEIGKVRDTGEKFRVMSVTAFEYLKEHPDLRAIITADPNVFTLSEREDQFRDINQKAAEMLKSILRKGIEEGEFLPLDVNHAVEFIYSVYIMFIIKAYVKSEESSADLMFSQGLNIILKGLYGTKGPKKNKGDKK